LLLELVNSRGDFFLGVHFRTKLFLALNFVRQLVRHPVVSYLMFLTLRRRLPAQANHSGLSVHTILIFMSIGHFFKQLMVVLSLRRLWVTVLILNEESLTILVHVTNVFLLQRDPRWDARLS